MFKVNDKNIYLKNELKISIYHFSYFITQKIKI